MLQYSIYILYINVQMVGKMAVTHFFVTTISGSSNKPTSSAAAAAAAV
jgi:hypothetical protein